MIYYRSCDPHVYSTWYIYIWNILCVLHVVINYMQNIKTSKPKKSAAFSKKKKNPTHLLL